MELLMASTSEHAGLDDPNTGYLLQAASRIAQCMGRAFAAYLPRLLPLVFALAELDPKLQISDSADDGDDEAAVVQIKGMGKMRVGTPRLSNHPTVAVPHCACPPPAGLPRIWWRGGRGVKQAATC